jgi:hypothetical protein|tara:strand:- start:2254 stop:2535 length:282 start_codon:yes stop_codon:yes gene_type:complete
MVAPNELFDRIKTETSNPPSPERLGKAADLVMDFTEQTALPNLEILLQLADRPVDASCARSAKAIAAEMRDHSALLDEEIDRFLSLSRDSRQS